MARQPIVVPVTVVSREDVVALLREAVDQAGGQRRWAEAVGVNANDVSSVLSGRRAAGRSILAALGVTRETVRRQA